MNLTSVMSLHGPKGISSNAVAPGAVATNIMDQMKPPRVAATMQALGVNMANMGTIDTSDKLAEVILFLASDDALYVNGVVMRVDGGWITP